MEFVNIYKLTDCDGKNYIGRTSQRIKQRICEHRYDKKNNRTCSSKHLNLNNMEHTILEVVPKSIAEDRERYYIRNTDCVNDNQNMTKDELRKHKIAYTKRRRLELKLTHQFLKYLEDY